MKCKFDDERVCMSDDCLKCCKNPNAWFEVPVIRRNGRLVYQGTGVQIEDQNKEILNS